MHGFCSRPTELHRIALRARLVTQSLPHAYEIFLLSEVDFCASNPCKENGRCLSGKNGYRCHCYEGYVGDKCDGKRTPQLCFRTRRGFRFSSSHGLWLLFEPMHRRHLLSAEGRRFVRVHLPRRHAQSCLQCNEYAQHRLPMMLGRISSRHHPTYVHPPVLTHAIQHPRNTIVDRHGGQVSWRSQCEHRFAHLHVQSDDQRCLQQR